MKLYLFAFILFFMTQAFGYDFKAVILEKGTQIPLKDTNVYLMPTKTKQVTNSQGEVQFLNLNDQSVQIVIAANGYLRFEQTINLTQLVDLNQTAPVVFYIEKENYNEFETVIVSQRNKKDQSQKTLSRREFLSVPGANGDPIKAVQNLPGVNRTTGFSSTVVIQGSAPKDTSYDFEGHAIPIVFHFGGLSSVVMPEAIEQIDYLSAGYAADYSRAVGGIISLKSRNPEVQERSHKGLFYLDNLSAGGLFESQIDDQSSFLVSGRYSYIGFFLKQAAKNNDSLDLTVAPEFQDVTAVYTNNISKTEKFKVSLLASQDKLGFVFNEPVRSDPLIRGSFSNSIQFFRIIPSYTLQVDSQTTARLSLGVGKDEVSYEISDQYLKISSNMITQKAEWDQKINSNWQIQAGLDNQYAQTQVNLKLPLQSGDGGVSNPISTGVKKQVQVKQSNYNLGLYLKNTFQLNELFEIMPGLRYDYFSQTQENYLLPRFASRYKIDETVSLKFATGLYVQPPEAQESNSDVGNPDIKSPQALNSMIGLEKDFREGDRYGSILTTSIFDRHYKKLVTSSSNTVARNGSSVYELYNNSGAGKSYGLEAQWKFFNPEFNGFLSYTLSKSLRWDPLHSEYNFQYDQTHNFNLVIAHDLTDLWKISGRLRYVTGNPMTPVIGSTYDADNEVYIPKRGSLYSSRMNDFKQLDVRFDKKIILDKEIWSVYLDIQNILNIKNPEAIQYSYDYSQKTEISGLPFLPALGIKGEF